MIIISVKEAVLLLAVDAIVGGVEVEDQVCRWRRVGSDALVDEDLSELEQGLSLNAILQPAQGGRRCEGQLRLGWFPGSHLENRIGAEGLVVIEILVPQGNRGGSLGDHGALVMDDEAWVSGVGNGGVECVKEADLVGGIAEQQGTGVGSEQAAPEIGDDGLGAEARKVE